MHIRVLAVSALLAMMVPAVAAAEPLAAPGAGPASVSSVAAPVKPVTTSAPVAVVPPPPTVVAPPIVPKKHGSRLPGLALMVLGGAALGSGAVFGSIATATGASVRSQCNGNVCPSVVAPDIAKTKSFEGGSYAAFAAGGVFAAVGLVLALVAPGEPEPDEAPKSARLVPWVGHRGGGVGFTAAF